MPEKAKGNYITEDDVDNWGVAVSATAEFDPDDVNTTTEQITVDIVILTGSKIRFSSTGVLPGGLETDIIYYAIKIDTTDTITIIQVASSPVKAAADPPVPINITSKGIGTHTIDVGEGESLADRQSIIDEVEAQVERITKDYFYPKTFHEFLDGNGRDRLFLSIRQKMLSINYMAVSEMVIPTIDKTGTNISGTAGEHKVTLTITTTENYYKNTYLGIMYASEPINNLWGCRILGNTTTDEDGKSVFTLEQPLKTTLVAEDIVSIITDWAYDDDCIYRNPLGITHEPGTLMEPSEFFLNGYFPKGQRNIEIKGTIGHYTCPQAIKNACIILARDENDSTLYEHYEFKREDMGGVYSYDRGEEKYLSGIIECDRYLRRYINRRPVLAV